jgi:hypothetical protein
LTPPPPRLPLDAPPAASGEARGAAEAAGGLLASEGATAEEEAAAAAAAARTARAAAAAPLPAAGGAAAAAGAGAAADVAAAAALPPPSFRPLPPLPPSAAVGAGAGADGAEDATAAGAAAGLPAAAIAIDASAAASAPVSDLSVAGVAGFAGADVGDPAGPAGGASLPRDGFALAAAGLVSGAAGDLTPSPLAAALGLVTEAAAPGVDAAPFPSPPRLRSRLGSGSVPPPEGLVTFGLPKAPASGLVTSADMSSTPDCGPSKRRRALSAKIGLPSFRPRATRVSTATGVGESSNEHNLSDSVPSLLQGRERRRHGVPFAVQCVDFARPVWLSLSRRTRIGRARIRAPPTACGSQCSSGLLPGYLLRRFGQFPSALSPESESCPRARQHRSCPDHQTRSAGTVRHPTAERGYTGDNCVSRQPWRL